MPVLGPHLFPARSAWNSSLTGEGFVLWCSSSLEGRWEFGSCQAPDWECAQRGCAKGTLRCHWAQAQPAPDSTEPGDPKNTSHVLARAQFCLVLVPKNNLEEREIGLEHKARCQSLCQSWCHREHCPGCAPSQLCSMGLVAGCCCRVLLFFKTPKVHNLGRKSCSSPNLGESHF